MLRLKECSRCRGDMYLERSPDGHVWVCLQCGKAVEEMFQSSRSPAPVPVRQGTARSLALRR